MRRLSVRLMAFNLLLLFLPLASLLYLDTYERQLLDTQESSMIQQGRLVASALSGSDLSSEATRILERLGGRVDSRIRVIGPGGRLLVDSASMSIQPPPASSLYPRAADSSALYGDEAGAADDGRAEVLSANERLLYKTVVYPLNALRRLVLPPRETYDSGEYYSGGTTLLGPEVMAALNGRYGAITRLSTGGQVSVNLYSAIPIAGAEPDTVMGAVLVSRSTYGILVRLYELRLDIIKIFLFSLLAALILSLALSLTITMPIGKLKSEAGRILDGSGRFRGHFTGLKRKDEIGDLSRALSELSAKLEKRVAFIDGFTADMLHELKNPLAVIRGAVELALDSPEAASSGAGAVRGASSPDGAPAEARLLLMRIRDEELRMERLLSRLREIGRIDNRMEGEAPAVVDLAALVPVVLSRYPHKDYPSVPVRFIDDADGKAMVRINPDRLVQMLANPVDNAVSFSPAGSAVGVRLYEGSVGGVAGYVLSVDDDGPGVRLSSIPRAFDRFYSDRPEGQGDDNAGLGLSIVQAIVSSYGGACALENRTTGGCRFSLALPRA